MSFSQRGKTGARRAVMAGVIAVLAIAALACGASGGGGGAPQEVATEAPVTEAASSPFDSLDPCTLLTQDEATAFFGKASKPGNSQTGSLFSTCTYQTDDGLMLVVGVEYNQAGGLNADDYKMQKTDKTQDVAGLGDGAYYDTQQHFLQIAKGPWMVRLNGLTETADAELDKLQPLAPNVLSRLP